jgi:hypothetical protein
MPGPKALSVLIESEPTNRAWRHLEQKNCTPRRAFSDHKAFIETVRRMKVD